MSIQIFKNGLIYTLNEGQPFVSSIVVKNGLIADLGETEQLLAKYKGHETEVIDFEGKMVLPGLTDSHMHLVAHGMKLLSLDFSQCTDALEMKKMLKEKIEQTPKGEWVIGRGWNENSFLDKKIFTKNELDELSAGHPIFLTRICGHAYLANSMALSLAGIEELSADPVGGKIDRNQEGLITGLLLENAGQIVQNQIPALTYDYLKESLQVAIKDCWSLGLVGAHTEDVRYCGGFNQTYRLFDEVLHQDGSFFRVNQLVFHEHIDEMIGAGKTIGSGTPFFTVGAMKIFADGAMGGRSALLSEPYSDDASTRGVAMHTPEELKALVRKARIFNLPIAVHTIGDLALELTLDAIEENPIQNQIDRIIHAQVLRSDLLERMLKLPIVVDIQPRFVAADFPWVIERLGEDRIGWCYAWKTLVHSGLHCAGGSDAPIEPVDPLLGIHAAVTRRRPEEDVHEGYLPEQKLSPLEAIHLFTTGSAYAEQKTNEKGTIEIGKVADFTVYDQDLFATEPEKWLENKVFMTIVNGKIVYQG
jgi:predicted amidohydrolase YtcJ